MTRSLVWMLLCLMPALATAQDEPLRLGFKGELLSLNRTQVISREPLPAGLETPLGSVWKLFVYGWLVDTGAREPAYECRGQSKEEVYCCTAGGKIERDQALVKSCGLYFEPGRLGITGVEWRQYWQARQAPEWLLDLPSLQPATRVPVPQLLQALSMMPAQDQARRVLLDVVLNAADGNVVGELGGRLRVKTWSWLGDRDPSSRQGGFAGWLADGTPIWAGGRGTSHMVWRNYGAALSSVLPVEWPADAGRCVEVGLFSRYPIERVLAGDQVVESGPMQGDYRVEFTNGNQLDIHSDGELFLTGDKLVARLDREEYVARVLQREATSEPAEAAKALAVAIRTYLLQNATRNGDCLSIDDSSQRQRVAPRPATVASRNIAAWTSDLVLAGSTVTYHSDQPGPDKLSWLQAVEQAKAGQRYDAILLHAYLRGIARRPGLVTTTAPRLAPTPGKRNRLQRAQHLRRLPPGLRPPPCRPRTPTHLCARRAITARPSRPDPRIPAPGLRSTPQRPG
jgi:uncharacterized protein YfaQ (DUF2300 family)